MTLDGAELELTADVDGTGETTGTFWLGESMQLSAQTVTGDLIGQAGSTALSIIDFISGEDQGRAGVNLDFGGGAFTVDVSFQLPEGDSSLDWGDGSGVDERDATGSDFKHQMSMFKRYIDRGEYDSLNPAVFSWFEFSDSGIYEPMDVSLQDPTATFDGQEQSSIFDGSLTVVRTRDLTEIAETASQQQNEK